MGNVNQKKCINVNFSEGLGIFDDHYGYPLIDDQEQHNGPTGKVVDIQGPQAHAGRNYFVPEGKEFSIDIDESPYLYIAIKAEEGANTCLLLSVHDKAPYEHVKRSVVIGRTLEGDAGIYNTVKDCFDIKDDGQWHEYDLDLRKIREKQDDEYPCYPDAGSISTIQFYSLTGTGEHTFHFNDLFSTAEAQMEIDNQVEEQIIEGFIYFDYGLPAAGIEVKLYSHGFMGGEECLDIFTTGDEGSYSLKYDVNETASLEIRTMDQSVDEEISLSRIMHDLGRSEKVQVNLIAPATIKTQPLAAEYQRLKEGLEPHLGEGGQGEMKNLKNAQENAERQDITMLNRATGWDARLIALASIAAKLSDDTEVGLSQEVLYGLFRAGLPSDKMLLAQVSEETVDQALEKMMEAGIVDEQNVDEVKKQFQTFSYNMRLKVLAPGSSSTYGDLLEASGLNLEAQNKFFLVYLKHRGDAAQLWEKAAEKFVEEEDIKTLQLQGKLAFLTKNSEAMTTRLQKKIDDPVELVKSQFYMPEQWEQEVKALAGNNKEILDKLIPPAYKAKTYLFSWGKVPGKDELNLMVFLMQYFNIEWINRAKIEKSADGKTIRVTDDTNYLYLTLEKTNVNLKIDDGRTYTFIVKTENGELNIYANATEERLSAYAEDMARKVRLSYPTHVVLAMIGNDEFIKLGAAINVTEKLLTSAADEGFRFGQTPVESFIRDHPDVLRSVEPDEVENAMWGMKTLQRVYQITPSNEAMIALLNLGLTSAYDVVALSQEDFLTSYGSKFPSLEQARLVHQKAQQVSSVTCNLFTIARKLDSEVQVYGMSAPIEVRESVKNELIKQFPTMESLFGSMDFCECEHCRSVLSPAAYLVDLLQFLDTEKPIWENFLNIWEQNHNGECYQKNWIYDHTGEEFQDEFKKPYYALIERRPDLPHISLTCENTNTALPYIDVVNEILEYYVANEKLDDKAAHDTGDATTAELLAEPQNVVAKAYTEVQQARYPLNLPFDLWIETVRQFCDYFETPLWQLLEAFHEGDELFVPTQSYDRAAIFIESLELSPAEYAIFTNPDPLAKWHELYGYKEPDEATTEATNTDTGQRIDLNSAKALSRRLGVTYNELVEIVRTGFVNPKLAEMTLLYKLGVAIKDVLFYRDHRELLTEDPNTLSTEDQKRLEEVKAFEARLDDLSLTFQASGFDAKVWLNNALDNNAFDDILVLADIDASCNFDQTTLRYSFRQAEDERTADPIAFLKINLFVRLWRKLGWTIEETDRALQAFVPKNTPFDADHLTQSPLRTALIYLAHLKALNEQLRVGKQSRLKLITLWSDLATTGKNPLYAQFFLTQSMLKSDAVFDDALGQYLSKYQVSLENVAAGDKIDPIAFAGEIKIKLYYDPDKLVQHLNYTGVLTDAEKARLALLLPNSQVLSQLLDAVQVISHINAHLPALQGALGLTANEIGCILTEVGKSIDTAELSLANVSVLYQYSLLGKALKLSIQELITLKDLSGLDPFKSLHPDPVASLDDDYPFTQTLRFVEIAGYVKESGLKIEDLDYLLYHHIEDTVGEYRLNNEATLVLMKTLAEGVRTIRAEHAMPDDAGSMGEEVLRQKLGLVLPPDIVERFLAMMNQTVEFNATRTGVNLENQLKPEQFIDEPSIRQLNYNDTDQEQKLTFRGVLLDEEKNELKSRLPKPVPPDTHIPSDIFSDLLDDVQEQALSFFVKNLQKQAPDVQPEAGFLDAADFDLLFGPTPVELNEEEQQSRVRQQRTRLAQAFLPFLQQRLIRQFIIRTLTAHTNADPVLVESLLTNARLLTERETNQLEGTPGPLLKAFTATGERGLTATFFTSQDASGTPKATLTFDDVDTSLKDKDGNLLKPQWANSARFVGYLEVPAPGAYRFYVVSQSVEFELHFDHLPDPLFLSDESANIVNEISEYLELKPGVLYRFSLTIRKLTLGEARLLVQSESLPKDSLAQLTLYPLIAIEGGKHGLVLLNKVLQLTQSLNLNEREMRYLLTHAADFDNLNLNILPTRETDYSPHKARTLFTQFLRLAGYARVKRNMAGGTDDLIGVFEANKVSEESDMDKVYQLIARLTRRDEATVKATANAQSATPAFANELDVQRLWEALQVVERFGVSVASVVEWTRIVSATATPEQRFAIARDLKEAIKARFEPETWQRVAQPIFDKLRQRQRDALVAHVMHQKEFTLMEQLYEYFLIDPGMEPVVQTSRIRLAIASVQLFIQRCLLNLEKHVHPSVINARHWEWMKRYRVWEANRKIFLFPENWLEPEFRDDKTHLFSELEGNLLQGDVSSDLVEDAFLNYLKKLDELARLDIVGMHIEEKVDSALNILHVIGRTYSEPHKYFYRRYAHQVWTPWEPVTAEIEGDHLAPVVWRGRLYLFWVTFMDKPDEDAQPGDTTTDTLAKAKLKDLMSDLKEAGENKQIDMQLHWSEYLQGNWSARESSGFVPMGISSRINSNEKVYYQSLTTVTLKFDNKSVFIHVSKESYENGEERGLYINLRSCDNIQAFYLAGRNSIPEIDIYGPKLLNPYTPDEVCANRYSGSGALNVKFRQFITTEDEKPPVGYVKKQSILEHGASCTLLQCDNSITLGSPEIASLVKPIFYQDNVHTLFMEPNVSESTIEEWWEWVAPTSLEEEYRDLGYVTPEIHLEECSIDPHLSTWKSPESLIDKIKDLDWLLNEETGFIFESAVIGSHGWERVVVLTPDEAADAIALGGQSVKIHTGSGLVPGRTVVALERDVLGQAGLVQEAGGINLVGISGFKPENYDALNRSGYSTVNLGSQLIRREEQEELK